MTKYKAATCVIVSLVAMLVQDPIKTPPAQKDRPTYKVDPLLKHVQLVSMRAWRLGRDISGDEQTIGFQGRHADKLRIMYKAEGDGFQGDAICDSGYTWTFYFRHQPAPQKWCQLGYSPLHFEFWQCLTSLINSTITVGLTICTCLQSLPRQHTHKEQGANFWPYAKKWKGLTKLCHPGRKAMTSRNKGSQRNCEGCCVGG